eukprot:scaffold12623_cov39-Cyclotella_meneghiniana.AAC.2
MNDLTIAVDRRVFASFLACDYRRGQAGVVFGRRLPQLATPAQNLRSAWVCALFTYYDPTYLIYLYAALPYAHRVSRPMRRHCFYILLFSFVAPQYVSIMNIVDHFDSVLSLPEHLAPFCTGCAKIVDGRILKCCSACKQAKYW